MENQYSCFENPMNSMKKQNDRTLKDELPRLVGAQYATGDHWRNNSRKNEGMEPKQKQYLVVDVTGDGSKVRCCKEQYCIGTWNVRSMLLLLSRFSRAQLCVTTETAAHQAPTSPLDHFQFALIHGPDIPGSYAILVFTASDLASRK